jgi:hypothetical protein
MTTLARNHTKLFVSSQHRFRHLVDINYIQNNLVMNNFDAKQFPNFCYGKYLNINSNLKRAVYCLGQNVTQAQCFKACLNMKLECLKIFFTIYKTILDPADFFDTKLTCPTPPDAPSTSLMILSRLDQPMCKGKTATYSCDAGGINAFEVSLRYLAVFDVIWPLLMLFGS